MMETSPALLSGKEMKGQKICSPMGNKFPEKMEPMLPGNFTILSTPCILEKFQTNKLE
jgi:hypothetical protein